MITKKESPVSVSIKEIKEQLKKWSDLEKNQNSLEKIFNKKNKLTENGLHKQLNMFKIPENFPHLNSKYIHAYPVVKNTVDGDELGFYLVPSVLDTPEFLHYSEKLPISYAKAEYGEVDFNREKINQPNDKDYININTAVRRMSRWYQTSVLDTWIGEIVKEKTHLFKVFVIPCEDFNFEQEHRCFFALRNITQSTITTTTISKTTTIKALNSVLTTSSKEETLSLENYFIPELIVINSNDKIKTNLNNFSTNEDGLVIEDVVYSCPPFCINEDPSTIESNFCLLD